MRDSICDPHSRPILSHRWHLSEYELYLHQQLLRVLCTFKPWNHNCPFPQQFLSESSMPASVALELVKLHKGPRTHSSDLHKVSQFQTLPDLTPQLYSSSHAVEFQAQPTSLVAAQYVCTLAKHAGPQPPSPAVPPPLPRTRLGWSNRPAVIADGPSIAPGSPSLHALEPNEDTYALPATSRAEPLPLPCRTEHTSPPTVAGAGADKATTARGSTRMNFSSSTGPR